MIRYNLICAREHEFEGWFSSSSDYDDQAESGLLSCPSCGTKKVEKAIMAPAVKTARKTEARQEKVALAMSAAAAKIRDEIGKNCENVGTNFAELKDEGIEAHPLPDMFMPETEKPKLN